jgi:hypothetical protein
LHSANCSLRPAPFVEARFGVGKDPSRGWDATEDFRWPKALEGFLNKIFEIGNDRTELVIVGDMLELWQPPADIPCTGDGADLGCSIDEMARLTALIAAQHQPELALLKAFSARGENRLHIIVGNHDSTLRYSAVWQRSVQRSMRPMAGSNFSAMAFGCRATNGSSPSTAIRSDWTSTSMQPGPTLHVTSTARI